jgi:hypothetical protein
MNRAFLLVACVALTVILASAPSAAARAAGASPAVSTESVVSPAAPPAANVITSDYCMKKCAEQYKAASTYYEDTRLSMSLDMAGKREESNIHLTAAFKRPGTVKVDMTGDVNAVVCFSKGEYVYLDRDCNTYTRTSGMTLDNVVTKLAEFSLDLTPLSSDFYSVLDAGVVKIHPVVTGDVNGRPAYVVGLEQEGGVTVRCYFDAVTFYLIKVVGELPIEAGAEKGRVTYTKTCDTVLIDKMPAGPDGKVLDVFAFSLPKGATAVEGPASGEMESPTRELPSTEAALPLPSTETSVELPSTASAVAIPGTASALVPAGKVSIVASTDSALHGSAGK